MLDYSALKDEDLVLLANENDSLAFSTLTEKYIPISKYHASLFSDCEVEKEDLTQEGMIGFLSAVFTYKSGMTVSFGTYASRCIKNRIVSCVRLSRSKKRVPQNLLVPIENCDEALQAEQSPENELISKAEANRISLLISKELTPKEQQIFRLFLSGMSYGEIAEKTGSSKKSVDGTLQRIRKKLRRKLS